MQLLLKKNRIYSIGAKITYGKVDPTEPTVDKWRVEDENGNLISQWIGEGFEVVETTATLPSDYESGKYFYENGEFVLNPNWKKYVSPEERISQMEATIKAQQEEIAMLNDTLLEVLMG